MFKLFEGYLWNSGLHNKAPVLVRLSEQSEQNGPRAPEAKLGKFTPPEEDVILYDVEGEIILTYKGNLSELSSVQKIEYSYARNSGGGGGMEANPSEKVYGHRFSHGGAMVDRNEAFNVIVNLDGKKETIEVKRLNKL